MKTFLGSFLLPAFLLASTVLSTLAEDVNPCRACGNLEKCLPADFGNVKELWDCMGGQGPVPVQTVDDMKKWCCEKCLDFVDLPHCEDKPSIAPRPSQSPRPSYNCAGECCDCVHTCTIQPDPHYRTWDNSFYDFQGGCDQYAIKNDIIEVQIATRPRNFYSTITQITVIMKVSNEMFKIATGSPAVNTITTDATYSVSGNQHRIDFFGVPSFIQIYDYSNGLSLQVQGHGTIFSGSDGMCGNWDLGGVNYEDGTPYSTAGGWAATALTSFPLALSWNIPPPDNELLAPAFDGSSPPNPICDASSTCCAGCAFDCTSVRKLQGKEPVCKKKCKTIEDRAFRDACKLDVENTGDPSWACQESYLKPVLKPVTPCDFKKRHDEKCKPKKDRREGYICERLGGTCETDCKNKIKKGKLKGYACLKGICETRKKWADKQTCYCLAPLLCPWDKK